jgi:OH-DDVA oxygenase
MAKNIKDGRLVDPLGYHPPRDVSYPIETDLAHHIVSRSMHEGFDLTACMKQPKDAHEDNRLINLGHAYAFVYRRILRDKQIPMVPILVNTFYPPNQPLPKRCYDLGRMIGRAIKSWDRKLKVAVCGSGGLTHFVIDEAFDEKLLKAMKSRDEAVLTGEADEMYRSGTSETKNWLVCAGIVAETDLEMNLLDYVPCYRSEAGTGNAMAFATWR